MIVSLSILNIKEEDRESQIKKFMKIKNNWIHFDVMDGKFVENKTFDYEVVEEVNCYCDFSEFPESGRGSRMVKRVPLLSVVSTSILPL